MQVQRLLLIPTTGEQDHPGTQSPMELQAVVQTKPVHPPSTTGPPTEVQ